MKVARTVRGEALGSDARYLLHFLVIQRCIYVRCFVVFFRPPGNYINWYELYIIVIKDLLEHALINFLLKVEVKHLVLWRYESGYIKATLKGL